MKNDGEAKHPPANQGGGNPATDWRFEAKEKVGQRVFSIPLVGSLLYFCVGLVSWATPGPSMRFLKYRRLDFGTCKIWMPAAHERTAIAAVGILRQRDNRLFSRLTGEKRLAFFYNQEMWGAQMFLVRIYKTFAEWGPGGIALCLVEGVLYSDAQGLSNPYRTSGDKLSAVENVPKKLMEWMSEHGMKPDLIEMYRKWRSDS